MDNAGSGLSGFSSHIERAEEKALAPPGERLFGMKRNAVYVLVFSEWLTDTVGCLCAAFAAGVGTGAIYLICWYPLIIASRRHRLLRNQRPVVRANQWCGNSDPNR